MTKNNSKKKTFAERAASEPTDLQKRFAEWIEKETGIKPDLKTVQLAVSLRMDFQRSDANQSSLSERKAEAAKKEAARKAKRLAQLEKELAALKAAEETAPAPGEDEPEEPVAPVAEEAKADEVEVKADATETPAEESKVEEAPKPARRSRRTRTVGQQPVV